MRIVKPVQPPKGLQRLLFRLPIRAYHAGLGRLFGRRLLLLHHTGRVSGKPREVVLEVVEHDPRDGSYVVASGWGPTAAWYRNVMHNPQAHIQVAGQTFPVTAVALPADEGADLFARYAGRHRFLATHLLPRLMGFAVDGSDEDFRAAGRRMPFVRFVPRGE